MFILVKGVNTNTYKPDSRKTIECGNSPSTINALLTLRIYKNRSQMARSGGNRYHVKGKWLHVCMESVVE